MTPPQMNSVTITEKDLKLLTLLLITAGYIQENKIRRSRMRRWAREEGIELPGSTDEEILDILDFAVGRWLIIRMMMRGE